MEGMTMSGSAPRGAAARIIWWWEELRVPLLLRR
jgi:hypothetical protein